MGLTPDERLRRYRKQWRGLVHRVLRHALRYDLAGTAYEEDLRLASLLGAAAGLHWFEAKRRRQGMLCAMSWLDGFSQEALALFAAIFLVAGQTIVEDTTTAEQFQDLATSRHIPSLAHQYEASLRTKE